MREGYMKVMDKYQYKGWKNCIRLETGDIELIATTDIGPRIIKYGFTGDKNLFFVDENDVGRTGGEEWRLYGGTRLWHAPENIPRTYYPDNEPVKFDISDNELILEQKTEKTTGLQKQMIIKSFDKDSNSLEIVYRIYNRNLWPVKFSVWALSVMEKNGKIIVPHEPFQSHSENLLPARPIVLWAYTDMADPRWIWGSRYIQLKQDPSASTPQKIGIFNRVGWAAYYLKDNLFIKKFACLDNRQYPDFQSNMEVYTDKNIIEFETLGNMALIEPGGFGEHKETWQLFKAQLGESEESIGKTLSGGIHEIN
jgi:hypothetical protein